MQVITDTVDADDRKLCWPKRVVGLRQHETTMAMMAPWSGDREKLKKIEGRIFMEKPSQKYEASPSMWDHTVLPVTRHK